MVTGAASGIGADVARSYAANGAKVALVDIDVQGAEHVRAELSKPDTHYVFPSDLADLDQCESVVNEVFDWAQRIDVLVNAAAYLKRVEISDVDKEHISRSTMINMAAPLVLARTCAEYMRKNSWGRIILFTSQGAFTGGFNGSAVYAMTKAGVGALVKSLAREYAEFGITVNAISPGAADTPMLHSGMSDGDLQAFREKIPMGRFAAVTEVSAPCVFLGSDDASYITGATLDVNGGQLMR